MKPGSDTTTPPLNGLPMSLDEGNPRGRPRKPPIAPASVYAPLGRRRWWWYAYRCRTCGAHQFGRAKSLDLVAGVRRASCGHQVSVMAARIYTSPEAA